MPTYQETRWMAAVLAIVLVIPAWGHVCKGDDSSPLPDLRRTTAEWSFHASSRYEPRIRKAIVAIEAIARGGTTADAEWRIWTSPCLHSRADTAGVIRAQRGGIHRWTLEFEQIETVGCVLWAELQGRKRDGGTEIIRWSLDLRRGESGSVEDRHELAEGNNRYSFVGRYLVPVGEQERPSRWRIPDAHFRPTRLKSGNLKITLAGAQPELEVLRRPQAFSRRTEVDVLVDQAGKPVAVTVLGESALSTDEVNTIKAAVKEWKFHPAVHDGAQVFDKASLNIELMWTRK